jgi:ATP-dependent Clp protease protease subunit
MGAGYSIRARGNASADIFIYEDVGEGFFGGVSAKQFSTDLKGLGQVETINLHLNSYGGEVFDGLAIYRQLVDHPARVITHIDGLAASIASVIAMAGNEIRIAESGFVMIHNALALALGDAAEMRRMADLLETTTGSIADVYASRTGLERTELLGMMDAETWLTGPEAVDKGFANETVANLKVTARAVSNERHHFRHTPAALLEKPRLDAARSRLNLQQAQVASKKLRAA